MLTSCFASSSKKVLFNLVSLSYLLTVPNVTYRAMSFQAAKDRFLSMTLDEKRKHYKCGANYVTLGEINTWPQVADDLGVKSGGNSEYKVNLEINNKIGVFVGDMTALEIDAVVNAANAQLAGGGGIDGCIHRAAGHEDLQAECRTLNGCETGKCKITGGYRLPAKYILHCVGPVGEKPNLLASTYKAALDLLAPNKLRSVAFPCISTGVYAYDNEKAANVALKTVRDWLENPSNQSLVDRVIFCLFLDKDVNIYHKLLPKYFPIN